MKSSAGQYAVYFHCQTDLVETFRELYPELSFSGNRAILLDAEGGQRGYVITGHELFLNQYHGAAAAIDERRSPAKAGQL